MNILTASEARNWIETESNPGQKLRMFFQKGNPNNAVFHVRGVVDNHLILRRWGRQGWKYQCENYFWLQAYAPYISVE